MVAMDLLLSTLRIVCDKWINANVTVFILCV